MRITLYCLAVLTAFAAHAEDLDISNSSFATDAVETSMPVPHRWRMGFVDATISGYGLKLERELSGGRKAFTEGLASFGEPTIGEKLQDRYHFVATVGVDQFVNLNSRWQVFAGVGIGAHYGESRAESSTFSIAPDGEGWYRADYASSVIDNVDRYAFAMARFGLALHDVAIWGQLCDFQAVISPRLARWPKPPSYDNPGGGYSGVFDPGDSGFNLEATIPL